MKGVPRWLLLVAAMAAVGPVSIDMYLPGFPAIEREFGVRGVETTMAAYLVGIAVSQLFYGRSAIASDASRRCTLASLCMRWVPQAARSPPACRHSR
jgi:MFS family permease